MDSLKAETIGTLLIHVITYVSWEWSKHVVISAFNFAEAMVRLEEFPV